MREDDARFLGQEAQERIRMIAIKMLLSGHRQQDVADALGVSRQSVSGWKNHYNSGGWVALGNRTRGVRLGTNRQLSTEQVHNILQQIHSKTPDQLKLPFSLWTRQAVRTLIERHYGLGLSERTMGNYLKRWGLSVQNPLERAFELYPVAMKKWGQKIYPAIEMRARQEKAEIYYAAETVVNAENMAQSSHVSEGAMSPARISRGPKTTMIYACDKRDKLHWMLFDNSLDAGRFLKFLQQLVKYRQRKVFLILDNRRIYRARIVREWLNKNCRRIELFYLPADKIGQYPDPVSIPKRDLGKVDILKRRFGTNPLPKVF